MPCTLGSIPQAAVPTKPAPDSAQRPRGLRPQQFNFCQVDPDMQPQVEAAGYPHSPVHAFVCVRYLCFSCKHFHADFSGYIIFHPVHTS